MSNKYGQKTESVKPMVYQIRLKGHLGYHRKDWFEGMTVVLEENGDTVLTGPIVDQAALHGFLKKVRDMGIPLLSVLNVKPELSDLIKLNERRSK